MIIESYLKGRYDYFYCRKDESNLPLIHFICFKKSGNKINGDVFVVLPFNKFITVDNVFEINNKQMANSLNLARTNEKIAKRIINYFEKDINWDEVYKKVLNTKKLNKNKVMEVR